MSGGALKELRAAFAKLQAIDDDRGYQHLAGLHGLPLPSYCERVQGQPSFLPWHRAYLHRFELALRSMGHDVMLPWWDWVTVRRIPDPFERAPNGENPLRSVHINARALEQGRRRESELQDGEIRLARIPGTIREPGRGGSRLPTAREIEAVMAYPDFASFTSKLEDYHGNVHLWVGGHMGENPFSAYDPIFWAHHCMIDRLWRMWQLRHPQVSFPRSVSEQVLEPFNVTAGEVLDPTALGYDYVSSTITIKVKR